MLKTEPDYEVVQLLVGNMQNFSYIISTEGICAVVDPSFGGRIISGEVRRRKLMVEYILSTHSHFDHNHDNEMLVREFGAKVCAHSRSPIDETITLEDGASLKLGDLEIEIVGTPGHTPDSVCYLVPGCIFTGDTLFVGTCGRADLPGSDPKSLFRSLKRLSELPPEMIIYPGHDYGATRTSTIEHEKLENPALQQRSEDDFEQFVLG